MPRDTVPIDAPGGFLYEWWSVFWDVFSARANKQATKEAMYYVDVTAFFFPTFSPLQILIDPLSSIVEATAKTTTAKNPPTAAIPEPVPADQRNDQFHGPADSDERGKLAH